MSDHITEQHFSGDCLVGLGIPSRGIAVIDRKMKPCVFDIVHCNDSACGCGGYLKQIVRTGDRPLVQTCYKDPERDFLFFAREIYGVVIRVLDEDGDVVWERPKAVEYEPLRKAVAVLAEMYEKAHRNDYIHSPLAWALYHTWKKFDRR